MSVFEVTFHDSLSDEEVEKRVGQIKGWIDDQSLSDDDIRRKIASMKDTTIFGNRTFIFDHDRSSVYPSIISGGDTFRLSPIPDRSNINLETWLKKKKGKDK